MGRYRILVAGGAGFIGSNFVRFSRYLGNDIIVYDVEVLKNNFSYFLGISNNGE